MNLTNTPLETIFQMSFDVKGPNGEIMGKGMFEKDLERFGFKKKKLREFTDKGLFKLITTRYQGGWRNTYVLMPEAKTE